MVYVAPASSTHQHHPVVGQLQVVLEWWESSSPPVTMKKTLVKNILVNLFF